MFTRECLALNQIKLPNVSFHRMQGLVILLMMRVLCVFYTNHKAKPKTLFFAQFTVFSVKLKSTTLSPWLGVAKKKVTFKSCPKINGSARDFWNKHGGH